MIAGLEYSMFEDKQVPHAEWLLVARHIIQRARVANFFTEKNMNRRLSFPGTGILVLLITVAAIVYTTSKPSFQSRSALFWICQFSR
jgi:hypothetical protein